ncbi:hypothetical protein YC2023_121883 [Brassica napus]
MAWDPQDLLAFFFLDRKCVEIDVEHNNNNNNNNNKHSKKRIATILRSNRFRSKNKIKRGATRGLPRRSPILVLLSPKHA